MFSVRSISSSALLSDLGVDLRLRLEDRLISTLGLLLAREWEGILGGVVIADLGTGLRAGILTTTAPSLAERVGSDCELSAAQPGSGDTTAPACAC